MAKQDDYNAVLLEHMFTQNKAILEGLAGLKDVPKKLDKLIDDVEELKIGIKVVKAVQKDQGH